MSLQVWLPLTKDLRQQGLSDVTVSIMRGNETWDNNGKLGKCFYANGVNTLQINNIIPQLYNANGYSLCAWFYIESQNTVHTGSGIISAGNWNNQVLNLSVSDWSSDHYTRLRVSGTNWNNTYSYNFYKNTWYHAVVCSDGNKTYAYINGQLIGDTVAGFLPSSIEGNNIAIGGATYYSGMQFFGKINDVRIYDHCLSPMEVKQISQGLVLHYPLNRQGWGQENLLLNTNDLTKWSKESTCTITLENDGYYHIASTNTNSSRYGIYYDLTFPEVGTYTLSADVRTDWQIGFAASSSFGWTTNTITGTGNAQHIIKTITTTSENNKCRIYINSQMNSSGVVYKSTYIKNIKVEKGSISTPWCPNSADTLADTMGLNSNIEYDTSGFNNNGTKISTLTYTSDTPKYEVSTHIGSTSSKIHISNFPTSGFGNTYSFAWWGKRPSNSPMFWGFSDGIRLNGMYIGTLWNTGDGSNNPLYKIGTTTQVTAPSTGVWHHYVMIGNGTKCYVYLDGELWAEAKTYKAISGTSIYINGWDNSTQYCSEYTDISDFRIYATALSADDVKSLYQNCATIGADGKIYGQIRA